MPLGIKSCAIPRPSSLNIPRHVTELVPPPTVPKELCTPSPVKTNGNSRLRFQYGSIIDASKPPKQIKHVSIYKTSPGSLSPVDSGGSDQDGRGSSLSPVLPKKVVARRPGKLTEESNRTKYMSQEMNNSKQCPVGHKFVKSLNQHLHQSSILYKGSGLVNHHVLPKPIVSKVVSKTQPTSSTPPKTTAKRKVSSTANPGNLPKKGSTIQRKPQLSKPGTIPDNARTSTTFSNKKQTGNGRTIQQPHPNIHQPDVVKVGHAVPINSSTSLHHQIDRLELVVQNNKETLKKTQQDVKDADRGATLMSLILHFLSKQYCSKTALESHLYQVVGDLKDANSKILESEKKCKHLEKVIDDEVCNHKTKVQELRNEQEINIQVLKEKQNHEITKSIEKLSKKVADISEEYGNQIVSLKSNHEHEKVKIEKNHLTTIEKIKFDNNEEKDKEKIKSDKEKLDLEEQINRLKTKIQNLEENILSGTDYKIKTANEKIKNLLKEIDSLKMVVEMRTQDVRDLRADKAKLDAKLEMFDITEVSIKKCQAQVEDLKEQLSGKIDIEHQLLDENRNLKRLVQLETNERTRLSMENEQLAWKMNTNTKELSFSEDSDHNPTEVNCNYNSTPLTCSLRSLSAPPDNDPGQIYSPISPRVLEVVKKSDSMSWKIEYETAGSMLNLTSGMLSAGEGSAFASPIIKRKLNTTSSHTLRKCKSNIMMGKVESVDLMTQSLDLGTGYPNLSRSNSYSGQKPHALLKRTASFSHKSDKVRRKISPSFGTLSEKRESDLISINKPFTNNQNDEAEEVDLNNEVLNNCKI